MWIQIYTYHKFVNTTPKPRATKKSSGELLPLFPLLSPESVDEAGGGVGTVDVGGCVGVDEGILDEDDCGAPDDAADEEVDEEAARLDDAEDDETVADVDCAMACRAKAATTPTRFRQTMARLGFSYLVQ